MTRIFVGNLSHSATELQLRSLFSAFGRVASVSIKSDQSTGRPRGFAFITMPSSEDAEEAVARLAGVMMNGRPLTVAEAQSRSTESTSNEDEKKRIRAIFDAI